MVSNELEEGYYKIFHQFWSEDEESKTGWTGSGWGEDKDFELVYNMNVDKYGNPTQALFKYVGAIFLGFPHAAMNIQAIFLGEIMDYFRENSGKTYKEVLEENPEFARMNDCVDLLEERFEVKKYRNNE